MSKIEESGFTISMSKEAKLTKEMAEQLYGEHKDSEFFGDLTDMMSRYIRVLYALCSSSLSCVLECL